MNTVQRIRVSIHWHHVLHSFPHFPYVSHSSVLGIERMLPITGYFLGPGGRFRLWRWPFIQYTIMTVRVLRTRATWSWVSVIYDMRFSASGREIRQLESELISQYYICWEGYPRGPHGPHRKIPMRIWIATTHLFSRFQEIGNGCEFREYFELRTELLNRY